MYPETDQLQEEGWTLRVHSQKAVGRELRKKAYPIEQALYRLRERRPDNQLALITSTCECCIWKAPIEHAPRLTIVPLGLTWEERARREEYERAWDYLLRSLEASMFKPG